MRYAKYCVVPAVAFAMACAWVALPGTAYGEDCTSVASGQKLWKSGCYVVDSNVTNDNRVEVSGHVTLVLTDGYTLDASQGINVAEGNSLTITSQGSQAGAKPGSGSGTGKLLAHLDRDSTASALGGNSGKRGGTITIEGGTIDATAGKYGGSGIGGGSSANGGDITISGGTVTATGAMNAAGIGGGLFGDNKSVTISGGDVTAHGGYGAGIGGGWGGSGGTVIITGGIVDATGGLNGAGIGGGFQGAGGNVTISGGIVSAHGGLYDGGIVDDGGEGDDGNSGEESYFANGIGGGDGATNRGTFTTTESGTALICASPIGDRSQKDQWSGVVFEGGIDCSMFASNGKPGLYKFAGSGQKTINSNNGLTIGGKGGDLQIPEGVTLANNSCHVVVQNSATLTVLGDATPSSLPADKENGGKIVPRVLPAPQAVSRTRTSIKLKAIPGVEYCRLGAPSCQTSPLFSGLEPATSYSFRIKPIAALQYRVQSPVAAIATVSGIQPHPDTHSHNGPQDRNASEAKLDHRARHAVAEAPMPPRSKLARTGAGAGQAAWLAAVLVLVGGALLGGVAVAGVRKNPQCG